MNDLLGVITKYFSFLYDEEHAKFVDSAVGPMGSAMVLLVADSLRTRFVNDRGIVLLDFQSIASDNPKEWFQLDIIETMLTGVVVEDCVLWGGDGGPEADRQNVTRHAGFVKNRFSDIVDAFSQAKRIATEQTLRGLKAARAKRLFGA